MSQLDLQDLRWALTRLPKSLKKLMESDEWAGRIFVGGGYLRSIVAGEPINDVDVFVNSKEDAELIAYKLCADKKDVYKTDNAYTVKGKLAIQIIHRWVFSEPKDVSNSFDFTCCCAVIYYKEIWGSYCDDRFYIDIASKRLIYRSPSRNEDAGGSLLRVLKYYQKGYRIPLNSLGAVIARLMKDFDVHKTPLKEEVRVAHVITALLIEVDPQVDPLHLSHLPSTKLDEEPTK